MPTGIVDDVITRQPKPGMKAYDVMIEGKRYGHGFVHPSVAKGDYVQYEAEQKGSFANIKPGTLKLAERKDYEEATESPHTNPSQNRIERAVSNPKPSPSTTLQGYSKDDYWKARELRDIEREKRYEKREEEKQNRITFESSRKQAMDYVSLLAQTEALWMKKMDKAADRHEYVRALVEDTHRRFYNEACNRDAYLGNKPVVDEDLSVDPGSNPEDKEWN